MNRLSTMFFAAAGLLILSACGGGSSDPVDKYVGSWRSACFSYVGIDGKTYFQRETNTFTRASATSLNVTFSDTSAYSDPACNNVLGAISDAPDGTVQLGPKASFLDKEVDSISATFPTGNLVGYMTASATELFIIAEAPNVTLDAWGVASPFTRIQRKQAPASTLIKSIGRVGGASMAEPHSGYSR